MRRLHRFLYPGFFYVLCNPNQDGTDQLTVGIGLRVQLTSGVRRPDIVIGGRSQKCTSKDLEFQCDYRFTYLDLMLRLQ